MSTELTPPRDSFLLPAFESATVADVMRPGVMTCPPDAPLVTVAETMATHHVHCVVVAGNTTDDAGTDHLVWGLVSDMDVVRAAEVGIEGRSASDAARSEIVTVEPATPLRDAAALMARHAAAHLVVVERGEAAGVISSLDIAGALAWGRG
jgi:predicted transcriptional regulator